MSKAREIAAGFIAAAQANPGGRHAIYRRAAHVFAQLAASPQNKKSFTQLQNIAFDFAAAAAKQRPATIDDFENLLRESAVAYAQVGDDEMDHIAREREIHDEQRPIQQVSIAPLTFNRDATLGRSQMLKWAPSEAETKQGVKESETVAFWQGTKQEAQAVTVDVALISGPPPASPIQDPPTTPIVVRPYGIVEFGSDGNRTAVRFDVGAGKRFTVVGNYCSVLVGVDPPPDGADTALISIGASIGAFAAPSPCPTTLTHYMDEVPTGQTVFAADFIKIPLKAVQLLPVQSDLAVGESMMMYFFSFGGGGSWITSVNFTRSATTPLPPTIPLVGDVSYMKITHTGADARNFRLPFQLSL